MKLSDTAQKWFAPLEIVAFRRFLPYVVGANFLIAIVDTIRGATTASFVSVVVALLYAAIVYMLPVSKNGMMRVQFARICFFIIIIFGLFLLLGETFSLYGIWARSWMLIPAFAGLWALLKPSTVIWSKRSLTPDELAKGLARSRQYWPALETFAAHLLLWHACFLVLAPVAWVMDVAISPGNLLGGGFFDAFTLEHFALMLGGTDFWIWSRNSIVIAIGTAIFGLTLAVPAAYAFSRFNFAGRKPVMFSFILVQMFPGAIILVPYFLVMKTLGLLNTSIGLIIVYSVTALPLCIWMLKGFFDAVPRELEEAARLDGCSTAQIFIRIILPLSLPAVAVTGLFSFLTAWNEFMLALVFNTANDKFTLPVGLSSLIPANDQRWGDFAAASLLVSIPVVILFILFQRSLIQGLSSGAVKG